MDLYTQMDESPMGEETYLDYSADKYKEALDFLIKCNLTQYLPILVAEGFETMNAIAEITEEDLAAMGVKRGHRRVIQREVATRKGIPKSQPLSSLVLNQATGINLNNDWKNSNNGNASSGSSSGAYTSGYGSMSSSMPPSTPTNYSTVMKPKNNLTLPNVNTVSMGEKEIRSSSFSSNEEEDANNVDDEEEDDDDVSNTTPLKRKYRRHPKRDKHAPIKPPSAYIMFSNDARAQLKNQNLSFVEIAKYVGDSWKKLDPVQKQTYERTAMREKDKFIERLNQYRKTPEYKRYQDYLSDFKSKQDALNRKIARSRKKAKLRSSSSNGNNNTENDNENGVCNNRSSSNSTDSFNDPDNGSLTTTGEGTASSSSSGSSDIYKVHREKLKNKSNLVNENTTNGLYYPAGGSTAQNNNNNDSDSYSPQQKPPPPMSETMAKANYHRLPFSDNTTSSVPVLPPVKERTPEHEESRHLPLSKNRRSSRLI
ncbi:hypothetical protein K501DRAFT_286010 [Backusella circina FSU 941]|nr:hypothetical protein K501DRAFT_286010 [Backusella circina FSU 941]